MVQQLVAGDPAVFLGRPMLILPEALDALALGELSRFVGSRRGRGGEVLPYRRTDDGTAILTIDGPLENRGGFLGSSYDGIQYQLQAAASDPETKAVLLDIESPGGQAAGAFETAAAVRALAAAKPVVAVVNGMAASAAYAIASGATTIVTTPTGLSGSIGVVMRHADFSGMLAKAGVKATLIYAGAHKVDGNPYEPLSDEAKAALQREVDALYGQFVETVGAGRGPRLTPQMARDTEARIYVGADAVKAGLADRVGTFEEALAMVPALTGAARRGAMMATDRPEGEAAAASEWTVGAAEDLPIDMREAWDGPAAASRMLAAAGFDGANPDPAKARRGFLAYDHHNATLKGSYKLPFADIIGGELKATSGGLRAAASRLPQTDIPDQVRTRARAVIDGYEKRMRDREGAQGATDHKSGDDDAMADQAALDKAAADAVAADRARTAAVMALPEAKGREPLAQQLALKGLDAEAAKDVLAAAPKASELEARAGGFNPAIGSGGGGASDKRAEIDKSWGDIVAGLNREHAHLPGFVTPAR